jgi:hypothetical protein
MEISTLGEQIDRIITLDLPFRRVIDLLYPPAREKAGEPLAMKAAKELKRVLKAGNTVFIATGWPDRPHINPEIAETDGPPGAAVLGRALHRGFSAIPFFLIEQNLVIPMQKVVQAAGFKILNPDETIAAAQSPSAIHGATVLEFPTSIESAKGKAVSLIDQYKPAAIISIEKGGMNEKGIIHTSRGHDTTEHMAKVDFLIEEGKERGVLTIGIGDGGNEIGMGNIREDIQKNLRFGKQCICPCGSGIAPMTETDLLITATVSNWGAYGLAACLAILLNNLNVFHDSKIERWILEHASDAGFIDGISGFVEPGADGLGVEIHCHMVALLEEIVRRGVGEK